MVSFGSFHFFQSSPLHKTFPYDLNEDLKCFIFLRTAMNKDSKKFWCTLWIYDYDVIMLQSQ